ncbi:MAG: EAL domain-containing protein [Burkholderiaceae bacterium]
MRAALADAGLVPGVLRLEITETLAMGQIGTGRAARAAGHGREPVARRLRYRLLVTRLALDSCPSTPSRSTAPSSPRWSASSYQMALVQSTVQVADALRLAVVAEGVETEAQARALSALGCHRAKASSTAGPCRQPIWPHGGASRTTERTECATAPDDLHLETG